VQNFKHASLLNAIVLYSLGDAKDFISKAIFNSSIGFSIQPAIIYVYERQDFLPAVIIIQD
jgi:hypothetical protein